ncbi:Ig-like domain-containing protein [Aliikangiella coralliicola]|uniref:Tandem-95 repeat protein n=1 Tax=Aliikangiella coralliicola TaxID=2592383 RepID=A0A545UEU5_9GAMM|nr:Ig-like domain-containing protein [Aliikangiella coralliicola]TQV88002.1 tandem-95 repeat protein [Aliikangiella coralliicola]
MKRILAQLFGVFLFGQLVACGGGGGSGEPTPPTQNLAPIAVNVSINDVNGGDIQVGDELKGHYNYQDAEGDKEGATRFAWMRNNTVIAGATAATYIPDEVDAGQLIQFVVIPVALTGTQIGEVNYSSDGVLVIDPQENSAPIATDVSITDVNDGEVRVGDELTGNYTYQDADGDTEGATTFVWKRNKEVIDGATEKNYTLIDADDGKNIEFIVWPAAKTGAQTGQIGYPSNIVTVVSSQENHAPVAVDDEAVAEFNQAVVIDILANDTDEDNDELVDLVISEMPQSGEVELNGDLTVTYQPNVDFSGQDQFEYQVGDGNGGVATAQVTVTVNSSNGVVVTANDDEYFVVVNRTTVLDVLANDEVTGGSNLKIIKITYSLDSEISIENNKISYTAHTYGANPDSFSYTIESEGVQSTAEVLVTKTMLFPEKDIVETHINQAKSIDVLDNDRVSQGGSITLTNFSQPQNGQVSRDGDLLKYTPANDFFGIDSFTYDVEDNHGNTAEGTIVEVRVRKIVDQKYVEFDLADLTLVPNEGVTITDQDVVGNFPADLESIGDFNGDGHGDFVSCFESKSIEVNSAELVNAGACYIVYGAMSKLTSQSFEELLASGKALLVTGPSAADFLGQRVFPAGDINGDGLQDLILEVTVNNSDKDLIIVLGRESSTSIHLSTVNFATSPDIFYVDTISEIHTLSKLGDIDNDGYQDFGFSEYFTNEFAQQFLLTKVLKGRNGSMTLNTEQLTQEDGIIIKPGSPYSQGNMGWAIAPLGDVNNDEIDDFALTTVRTDLGSANSARAIVFHGAENGYAQNITLSLADVLLNYPYIDFKGSINNDYSGLFYPIGDLDNNGYLDLAWESGDRTYVVYMEPFVDIGGWLPKKVDSKTPSIVSSSGTGVKVRPKGDVNRDDKADLVIWDGSYNEGSGALFVLYGNGQKISPDTTLDSLAIENGGNGQAGMLFYHSTNPLTGSMTGLFDLNNDGYDDIVIGGKTINENNREAYIIYGSEMFGN